MRVVAGVFHFPRERGRSHAALVILLQIVALLALVTIVRDYRPDPADDPVAWEEMGAEVELAAITPIAVLLTVMAIAGLHAIDGSISNAERARECRIVVGLFAVAVVLVDLELAYFGFQKGIWEMFGAMAADALIDLLLVFLVLRFLDSHHVPAGLEAAGTPPA